jgi:hypothetical protein
MNNPMLGDSRDLLDPSAFWHFCIFGICKRRERPDPHLWPPILNHHLQDWVKDLQRFRLLTFAVTLFFSKMPVRASCRLRTVQPKRLASLIASLHPWHSKDLFVDRSLI